MGARVDALTELVTRADCMTAADEMDLAEMQIAAADERFQDHRKRIPILDQRATDTGIDAVRTLDDIVPLLFDHTTYKSYPTQFLTNGHWDRLLQWFECLSAESMSDVELSGVETLDDWIDALERADHFVCASSSTSGKCSFINQSQADLDVVGALGTGLWGWPSPLPAGERRPFFMLSPAKSASRFYYAKRPVAAAHGRPGAVYPLTEEHLLMGEVNQTMKIQQAMAAGSATPSEIEEFERNLTGKADDLQQGYERMAAALDRHREEPIIIWGGIPQMWALVETCRRLGIAEGGFHPDSIFLAGGGAKGFSLPATVEEELDAFFAAARHYNVYGMSETSTHSPSCEKGRFHVPPWIVPLVLDETGENRRYQPEGPVTGRAAFLDVAWDGHWGGTITGDWITADYGRCACGRPGPTIENSVQRARDVIGLEDDKVTCSGAIEAYIRGAIT